MIPVGRSQAALRLSTIFLSAALVSACTPGSTGCGGPGPGRDSGPGEVVWSVACSGLDDYVLSVWGPGPDDIFFVGGNGVSARALILHYDGESWVRTTGVSDQVLWWVWGNSGQDVWAVGENGEALHFDGGLWAPTSTGTVATLYGVFGTPGGPVWAVGGSIDPLGPKDVFLYWNGAGWAAAAPDVPSGESIFKVWGFSAADLWAVGTGGVIYHYNGSVWTRTPSPTTETLISLWGAAADDIWAVGGLGSGVILHYDGVAWALVDQGFSPSGLNGVWTAPGSSAIIVGHEGYAARFRSGAPEALKTGIGEGLHSVFGDGGGTWAVGGNLLGGGGGPGGVILRFGPATAACAITEFMQPPIPGGSDGGAPDPCPGGAGAVGPGEECGSGRDCQCMDGYECWYIVIQSSQVNNHFICTEPCPNAAACTAAFGAGSCCILPGPQTATTVCHSPGWTPVAGDPCN